MQTKPREGFQRKPKSRCNWLEHRPLQSPWDGVGCAYGLAAVVSPLRNTCSAHPGRLWGPEWTLNRQNTHRRLAAPTPLSRTLSIVQDRRGQRDEHLSLWSSSPVRSALDSSPPAAPSSSVLTLCPLQFACKEGGGGQSCSQARYSEVRVGL